MFIAHSGHWLTSVAYFLPVVAFLIWLAVAQVRERREAHQPKPPRQPRR